jgi:AraC-like DNA-binding protein
MSRIFKEVIGLTVMQYLMNCRMNRAKYLLEMDTEQTILGVALESGFESSSHFSRFFRQQINMTQSEYRERRGNAISVKFAEK